MANEVLIVNCDSTYPLDSAVSLFKRVDKHISIQQKILPISQLEAVSEEVLQRRLLCGVFVVNAYESRLSINEEKAGIGYAVLYRALLEAADGRALVVIGGDDRYEAGEQSRSVLSAWAYHKIAAQFDDTYLDGRRGFVFSWDERHNPVHEEALGGYLQAITSGQPGLVQPFKPTPRSRPLPQLEPFRRPRTSSDPTRSQTRRTDSKTHTVVGDEACFRASEKVPKRNTSVRATIHGRVRPRLPIADVGYTNSEAISINEMLKKHQDEIMKANPYRKIKFVGHLVYGKLVPGFGTFKGDIPDFLVEPIRNRSVQTKSASVFVFDEDTTQNFIVRDLTVLNEDGDYAIVRGLRWIKRKLTGN